MEAITALRTSLLAQKNPMLKGPVTIVDDYGHVDKDRVHISKGKNEQIVWHNITNSEVIIVFDESPFAQPEFVVPAGKTIPSGRTIVDPGPKLYKYTVIGSLGNNDPAVIIDP